MRVAILGCGYVGLALGRRLLDAGHEVVGVRRSDEGLRAVADAGIEAVRADVTNADSLAAVPDADALVYTVSAGGRDAAAARESYVEGLQTAIDAFGGREEPPDRLVYTSSTGVYGDHGGDWVDEKTELRPATERQRILVEAEEVARERSAAVGMDATVVRLAGIYGPGRYRLERYLDGPVREGWLNLVHRADAAGILEFVLDRDGLGLVVGVDDEPVAKPALAEWLAGECGEPSPATEAASEAFDGNSGEGGDGGNGEGGDGGGGSDDGDGGGSGGDGGDGGDGGSGRRARSSKRCSNRLLRSLGYEFAYPTYREGYREAVRDYRRG